MKISHLAEALPIKVAKEYRKAWDPNFHKEVFERQAVKDKNAYRIYLPLDDTQQKQTVVPKTIQLFLQTAIPNKPYQTDTDNYVKGIATEVGNPLRQIGIGKMIARSLSQAKDPVEQHRLQQIKNDFDNDPQRKATKSDQKLVVISRHPYDVAGMSTDRGWRSCMNLVDGINRHYVIHDVRQGCIIAYLINADDKNVNNPLARILIKPYRAKDDPTDIVMMGDSVYGTAPDHFKQVVDDWINKNYNQGKSGFYCISDKLYRDEVPKTLRLASDEDFASMPVKDVLKMVHDRTGYDRIARLRPDADQLLWQIAKTDIKAVKHLKHVDFDMFAKLFKKSPYILKYLPEVSPEIVSYALKQTPMSAIFLKDRTPQQQQLVTKILQKNPDLIEDVVDPTPDQVLTAIEKAPRVISWVLEHQANLLDVNQVKRYINYKKKNNDGVYDDTLKLILRHFPQIVRDDEILKWLAKEGALTLIELAPLTDQQILDIIPNIGNSWWREDISDRAAAKIKRVLLATPDMASNTGIMRVLVKQLPELVGQIPDAKTSDLKQALRNNATAILKWTNPSDDLIITALEEDPDLIAHFPPKKYPDLWRALIKQSSSWVIDQPDLPKELLMLVVNKPKLSPWVARRLLNNKTIDTGIKVRLIKREPSWIREVIKPGLALQMAAISKDPDVYDQIKPKDRHPAAKAYMAAYRKEMRKPE